MKIKKVVIIVLVALVAFCGVSWALQSAGMYERGYLIISAICSVGSAMAAWTMI